MRTLEGIVTVVQEGRFLLTTDDGSTHLLILSHAAAAEPHQLAALQRAQSRVRATCRPAPDLIGWVVRRLDVLEATA
ncbi:MAG: hypothetical protein BGO51_01520 [Rhodospirillales bacterium 69-11]|nr:hypothetical protein [Rhodospirillales bacterium]OJW25676.1 MAG: hypothetical protein BGO51_01520 [Rhodospirillales bacterium 69-11]